MSGIDWQARMRNRARDHMREASEIIDRINRPVSDRDALEHSAAGYLQIIVALTVFAFTLVAAVVVRMQP